MTLIPIVVEQSSRGDGPMIFIPGSSETALSF